MWFNVAQCEMGEFGRKFTGGETGYARDENYLAGLSNTAHLGTVGETDMTLRSPGHCTKHTLYGKALVTSYPKVLNKALAFSR